MQIYVCVKHVPDSAANIAIIENSRIDEKVNFFPNPYDEHAITEATKVRDKFPGSQIIAVCLGKEDAESSIRSAMAMGADRGILVTGDTFHDSITTAKVLKAVIEEDGNPDMIFTGKESIDSEGMQTQFRIGALFDFPVATNVVKLDIQDNLAIVDAELSGGETNTYEMTLPCVIGAGRGLNTPKYPTFPDVMKSKKKPIKKMTFSDLSIEPALSGTTIIELEPLNQMREPKEIMGDAKQMAQKIVTILKEEAKVI